MAFADIPAELQARAQWINWRFETRDNGTVTKIPVNPHNGYSASVTDPHTWSSFAHVCHQAAHNPNLGIGFVFTANDPYCGIDVDKLDMQNEVHVRVLQLFRTYAERSPSGEGIHFICKATILNGVNNRQAHVEMYSDLRFFTFTGDVYSNYPIAECILEADSLYKLLDGHNKQNIVVHEQPETQPDEKILETAWNAINGAKFHRLWLAYDLTPEGKWISSAEFASQSEGDQALINMLQFYTKNVEQTKRLFLRSKLARTITRKKNQDDYLNRSIKFAFDQTVQLVDFGDLSKSNPVLAQAKRDAETYKPSPAPDTSLNPFLKRLPGLVGELQDWCIRASPKPLPALCTASALAFMASAAGRPFNVAGTGLNLYMLALAPTGSGKAGMKVSLDRLQSALALRIPAITSLRGKSRLTGENALLKMLEKQPCCLSIVGEFAHHVEAYSRADTSNKNNAGMAGALLELYMVSGAGQSFDGLGYTDKDKTIPTLASPAYSILAESNPELLFAKLSEIGPQAITSGFLPRFDIIEHTTGDVPLNEAAPFAEPSPDFLQRCADFVDKCFKQQSQMGWKPINIEFSAAAYSLDKSFLQYIDGLIDGKSEVFRNLYTRVHMRARRLAALVAVGCNWHSPVIEHEILLWAQEAAVFTCENLLRQFRNGNLTSGDIKGEHLMADCIQRYFTHNFEQIPCKPTRKFHDAHVIDRSVIRRTVGTNDYFLNDRDKLAFNRVLSSFVANGILLPIDKNDPIRGKDKLATSAELFYLLSYEELMKYVTEM